jgi:hypothetical protein
MSDWVGWIPVSCVAAKVGNGSVNVFARKTAVEVRKMPVTSITLAVAIGSILTSPSTRGPVLWFLNGSGGLKRY